MPEYGGHSNFKITRQRRYEQYIWRGFLPFESFAFSKVPLSVPYTRKMRNERLKQYKWAHEQKWSKARWESYIKMDVYGGNLDPWSFLRQYEMAWRAEVSPNDPYLLERARKRASQKAEYRALHKGRINEQKRRYRELNRDKIAKYSREYRLKKRREQEH
jgi:hypothetical protein